MPKTILPLLAHAELVYKMVEGRGAYFKFWPIGGPLIQGGGGGLIRGFTVLIITPLQNRAALLSLNKSDNLRHYTVEFFRQSCLRVPVNKHRNKTKKYPTANQ